MTDKTVIDFMVDFQKLSPSARAALIRRLFANGLVHTAFLLNARTEEQVR